MYQSVRDCGRSLHPEEVLLSAPLPEEQVQDWLRWAFPVQLERYSGVEYSVSEVMHELVWGFAQQAGVGGGKTAQ